LGLECYYDGTWWLTVNEYTLFTWSQDTFASTSYMFRGSFSAVYGVYLERIEWNYEVATTNDGGNFWCLIVYTYTEDESGLEEQSSKCTLSDSPDTCYTIYENLGFAVTSNFEKKIGFVASIASGTPGAITASGVLYYRLIIT